MASKRPDRDFSFCVGERSEIVVDGADFRLNDFMTCETIKKEGPILEPIHPVKVTTLRSEEVQFQTSAPNLKVRVKKKRPISPGVSSMG